MRVIIVILLEHLQIAMHIILRAMEQQCARSVREL